MTTKNAAIPSFETVREGQRTFARVTCPRCGAHDQMLLSSRIPPEAVVAFFVQKRGWRGGGTNKNPRVTHCASCAKRPTAPTSPMEVFDSMAEQMAPPANIARIRVRAGAMILDNWSEEAGRYQQGWSDERVSKETGLSEQAIKRMRETDLNLRQRVPQEIVDVEKKIQQLFDQLAVIDAEVRKLREKHQAA